MKRDLPSGAPLFEFLFGLADHMQREGMALHVAGGLTTFFWHREHQSAPPPGPRRVS